MMNSRKTTNILLFIIVIPIVFYILKLLSFIFIPLVMAMFIALIFLPIMRKLNKKNVPKLISLFIVVIIIFSFIKISSEIVQISTKEILNSNTEIVKTIEFKTEKLFLPIESLFSLEREEGKSIILHYLKKLNVENKFGAAIDTISSTISMVLMTSFFIILLLAESLNIQKLLNLVLIRQKTSSIKVFMKIEENLLTFIKVKFVLSFFTGLGFTISCYIFGISFPIFWGLFAFTVNFIQMIGSFLSVSLLSLFSIIELDSTGILISFIITIILIQVILGGILEPIFMGKSFSINVIVILIMLMFWGFLWGIPGMILSIPITVFAKIIFEQFKQTRFLSILLSNS